MATVSAVRGVTGGATDATLTTASYTPGGSDRFILGLAGDFGFPETDPSDFRHGGSGGTSLSQIGADLAASSITSNLWGIAPGPTGSTTLYADLGGTPFDSAMIGVSFAGVDQTTPYNTGNAGQVSSNGTTATVRASITLTGTTSGRMVAGLLYALDTNGLMVDATAVSGTTLEGYVVSGLSLAAVVTRVASGSSTQLEVDLNAQFAGEIRYLFHAVELIDASGGASVALTGVSSTSAPGSVGATHAQPLTGSAATGAPGAISVTRSQATVGNAATGSPGTPGVAHSQPATGNGAAGLSGTVGLSLVIGLTGNVTTGSVGTLAASAGGDVTVGLTGVAATGASGSVAPTNNVATSGNSVTGAAGGIGEAAAAPLTGVGATGTPGTVAASVTGDVTVALTSVSAAGQVGSVSPAVSGDTQAQIDALRLQLEALEQQRQVLIGGWDYDDIERRMLLRDGKLSKSERIETQNRLLLMFAQSIVTTGKPPS